MAKALIMPDSPQTPASLDPSAHSVFARRRPRNLAMWLALALAGSLFIGFAMTRPRVSESGSGYVGGVYSGVTPVPSTEAPTASGKGTPSASCSPGQVLLNEDGTTQECSAAPENAAAGLPTFAAVCAGSGVEQQWCDDAAAVRKNAHLDDAAGHELPLAASCAFITDDIRLWHAFIDDKHGDRPKDNKRDFDLFSAVYSSLTMMPAFNITLTAGVPWKVGNGA